MPVSPKKRASNDRYSEKCDIIYLKPIKERGAAIRAAAAASGQSLQGYILQAVEDRMARETQAGASESPTVPVEENGDP